MRQDQPASIVLWIMMIVFAGVIVGREAHSQSPGPSKDDSLIQKNMRKAVVMMRTLAAAESAYYEHSGKGEFGTAIDLFKDDLIDSELANALGCPGMASAKGQECPGTQVPLQGYHYQLKVTRSTSGQAPGYSAVAVPAAPEGKEHTGAYTFFVDQSQVIRVSDRPAVEADAKSPALGTSRAPVIRKD